MSSLFFFLMKMTSNYDWEISDIFYPYTGIYIFSEHLALLSFQHYRGGNFMSVAWQIPVNFFIIVSHKISQSDKQGGESNYNKGKKLRNLFIIAKNVV